jgi:hypothetical protein
LVCVVLLVLVLLQLPGGTDGQTQAGHQRPFPAAFWPLQFHARMARRGQRRACPKGASCSAKSSNCATTTRNSKSAWRRTRNFGPKTPACAAGRLGAANRWRVKLARVIARDPANWWRSLEIDLGSRDGLRPNLAVLTSDGLVGRVQSVGETRSQVILLGDPNLRVAAMVQPTNGETGIIQRQFLRAAGGRHDRLGFSFRRQWWRPGQSVVTWGEGGVFPAGIPIGKIVDIQPKEYGLSTEARVKLAANMSALEEVWVMLP